ncbi:Retrovirus-related Pol polyprotein from transposon RE1 [Sesamum angolense]|uniref:Retrovirus-related Pol polyprotein from transposon RE1 n=1 Tax=Sesamum angolense TaxID=2727404 RepID=A0AAE1X6L2_9LAMI|nr:Retrovirus-related Pol polyprotein from transposon RE1 [Sesamum angolense]
MRTATETTAARNQSTENSSGLVMISAPFNGTNWLTWSRSVRIALEGKDKLGFIDGSYVKPHEGSADMKQWRITDSLVRTWILSTMTKDIVNAFLYVSSARTLWIELEARYGECDGLYCINPTRDQFHKSRSFSSVNKAYSMVLRVERQRRVNLEYADVGENTAMNTRNMEYKLNTEWYKDLNEQKKRGTFNNRVYVATEAQNSDDKGSTQRADIISELMEALKLVQTKVPQDPVKVHFAHDTEMADFLAALSTIQEPSNYLQAKGCKWEDAMSQELSALERNNTWEVVTLPKGKAIGSKWVFKIKLKADGSIDRYKARLVAKGYNQVEGVDYVDRFSPVAKAVTVRIFLAVASSHGWPIHQVDINNAFLHGFLDEDIYMHAPDGYHVQPGQVCKLKRSLYGLKQASRQWNLELTTRLIAFGFHQSSHDHCLFTQTTGAGLVALIVYVDDVLITCPSEDKITEIKHFLDAAFTIKDLGHAKYFLGLEIARSTAGTSITQHKFIRDIVRDAGLLSAKSVSSPLPVGLKLSSHSSIPLIDPEPYRRLVGRLLYLSFTRPDISFGAQQLSQFVHAPCTIHMEAALHLVRYLKGCPERGLFFPASTPFTLTAYCDADWASCVDSRRSLTGYCIFLGAALISWKTKKQTTVARSTAEAEYRSLGTTVCELQWVTYLLSDLSIQVPTPIPLYCDNQAAIHIVANPVFHERTKHLEIDCHLVRDKFKAGFVLPRHISGTQQLADVLTKSLSGSQFSNLLSKMGLMSFPQVHLEGG